MSSVTPARASLRRTASVLALLAVVLAGAGTILFRIDLTTRPPCKPGYVRLVDLEPAAVYIGIALAVLSGVLYWRARRGTYLRTITCIGVVMLLCIAFVDVGAVGNLVRHHGERYDDCWTF